MIQQHLNFLSKDFSRFQQRMDRLASHIGQAHKDVNEASVSARKITTRFDQIEKVEIDDLPELESGFLSAEGTAKKAGETA